MTVTSLRGLSLACCALSSVLVTVACGDSGSGGKGTSGAGAAAGTSSSGATGGSGGTSGSSSGAGATGGSSGGTTGGTSGGTTAGGMSAGGATGGAVSSGGTGPGTGGSTMAGASGTTDTGGGGGSSGSTGGGAGSAGSPSGGSAGNATGGDAGSGTGGKGGGGGGGNSAPVPSPGCGTKPAAVEDGLQHIDVGGTMRDYIIRVPSGYAASTPSRVIYAFHGMSGSADQVDKGDPPNAGLDPTGPYYGIKEHADPDVIFVAGQALSGGWTNSNGRDMDYVKALVSHLEGALCIDQSRRLVTGFSYGAIMTITVACNLSDMFRAVAPMSGSLQNGCPAGGQSIAYWSSHGSSDTTISPAKGIEARDEFVTRNGCDKAIEPVAFGSDGCVAFQGCKQGYPVNWCPFDGIHQPPPFSGPAIWAFLSQF